MPRLDGPNDETNWKRRLAGEQVETHPDEPVYGFYRVRQGRGGPFVPVAFWYTPEGDLRCKMNGTMVDDLRARELWTFASENPITHEVYTAVSNGAKWPDIDDTVSDQIDERQRQRIGGNNPPTDPAGLLKEQIDAAAAGVDQYKEIDSDDTLKKARSLHARLLELRGTADKSHKKEKEPHLEAGRAVDRKWFPLRDAADVAAKLLNKVMDAWETKKLRIAREEQRKRDAAAEAAARAAVPERTPDQAPPLAPAPPAAPAITAPAPIAPIKGAYGKAASVHVVNVITAVEDWDALYATFKERDEVRALLRKLADQAVRNGQSVPGVTIEEQAKVRG